ncbi:MAG: hypothetical protein JSU00_17485 [Acidobacteria bacterium]|nr:hypothetical protein [Acidobacteriota bacterium]
MTDWKAVAHALGLNIPEEDLARAVGPLGALETAFARAAARLEPGVEMASVFNPSPEDGQ